MYQEVYAEIPVTGVLLDPTTGEPLVDPTTGEPKVVTRLILKTMDNQMSLLLWIGKAEADAIKMGILGIEPQRPLTHDLIVDVIEGLGATLDSVLVKELRDGTFLGEVILIDGKGERIPVDARPSDVTALAVRTGAKILVADAVLEAAGVPIEGEAGEGIPDADTEDERRRFWEIVDPEDSGENPE